MQLAQNIYDLANKWAKRVQCKELCDLKLLACRLQWHVVVSVSESPARARSYQRVRNPVGKCVETRQEDC